MVVAVSESPKCNNNNGSSKPQSSSPSAPGKKPDANNIRKPRAKHGASRYLSQSPSTSSSTMATSGTTVSSSSSGSSAAQRFGWSQSAEQRLSGYSANAGGELSTAAKLLASSAEGLVSTLTRSLSVSFQGESFSLSVSKEKAANSAGILRKLTPERRRVASGGMATARDPSG